MKQSPSNQPAKPPSQDFRKPGRTPPSARWLLGALAALLSLLLPRAVHAQPSQAAADEEPSQDDERDEDPMGALGITLKLGMARMAAGDVPNPFYSEAAAQALDMDPELRSEWEASGACLPSEQRCSTRSRFGLQLAATLHLGGDGFGWDVEPYIAFADHAKAFGVYLGPKFDIHVAAPVYVGFGFGAKGAYVVADGWARAADIGGRIPVHVIAYVADDVALVAEFAFGAGASGYLAETRQSITVPNPGGEAIEVGSAPNMTFGVARTWDLTFGVRFP